MRSALPPSPLASPSPVVTGRLPPLASLEPRAATGTVPPMSGVLPLLLAVLPLPRVSGVPLRPRTASGRALTLPRARVLPLPRRLEVTLT